MDAENSLKNVGEILVNIGFSPFLLLPQFQTGEIPLYLWDFFAQREMLLDI
mgnify:CR=1 FL=1